ncbi:MAG: hypothetical protein AAF572_25650 [Cyanobacteria bacterium P01_B01_bin.77]
MTLQTKYWVAGLLGLSGISLSTLVPGGPIETRSFVHINPITLGAFNTFLTTLLLGSLLLIYFVMKSERWAMMAAAICGLSYLGVYGLDLAQIFPVSPDAMPPALFAIEVWGTLISFPLMALSMQALKESEQRTVAVALSLQDENPRLAQMPQVFTVIGLGITALGIIIFATRSAMGL